MIQPKPNIIQRQIVDVTVVEKSVAHEVQDRISKVYNESIIPLLEKLLSSFDHHNEVIRIDRLDLDLGKLQMPKLEEDLARQVKTQLEEKLTAIVYKARNNISQSGVNILRTEPENEDPGQHANSPIKFRQLKTNNKRNTSFGKPELFEKYLKTGRFPWWVNSDERDIKRLCSVILDSSWSPQFEKSIKSALAYRNIRLRLINMLSKDQLKVFVSKIRADAGEILFQLKSEIEGLISRISNSSNQKNLFRIYTTEFLIESLCANPFNTGNKFIKAEIAFHSVSQALLKMENSKLTDDLLDAISNIRDWKYSFAEKGEFVSRLRKLQEDYTGSTGKRGKEKANSSAFAKEFMPTESETIKVSNAGLVILWPYLEIFFSELGFLSENDDFKNESVRWKAIHLLHFLSSGEEVTEESELILNKLICNLSLEATVPVGIELSAIEKEECDHLLKVVVGNWPALKGTSIEGLRGSFINRDGILGSEDSGWMLSVENRPFDILLNKLQWPISVVKLPWNPYLIHVKW